MSVRYRPPAACGLVVSDAHEKMEAMKTRTAAAVGALLASGSVLFAAPAGADSTDPAPPGCGFTSSLPWSPCAETPPWNNYPRSSWSFDPAPRQWGPGGYHYCDYSEGCGG